MIVCYSTGVGKRDTPLFAFANSLKANVVEPDRSFFGSLVVLFGFASPAREKMAKCEELKVPFFHMDHAYFKRGYENGNFRLNFGFFHQTRLLDVPGDRMGFVNKRRREWQKGSRIVVIEPSEMICRWLNTNPKAWVRETELKLKRYTDRPICIKQKGGGLEPELRNCHAVVSLSSVAEVEAGLYGYPVFTSEYSPASQISEKDLSKIETPIYPDREQWFRTLTYSQFHVDELKSGKARDILRTIYGLEHLF